MPGFLQSFPHACLRSEIQQLSRLGIVAVGDRRFGLVRDHGTLGNVLARDIFDVLDERGQLDRIAASNIDDFIPVGLLERVDEGIDHIVDVRPITFDLPVVEHVDDRRGIDAGAHQFERHHVRSTAWPVDVEQSQDGHVQAVHVEVDVCEHLSRAFRGRVRRQRKSAGICFDEWQLVRLPVDARRGGEDELPDLVRGSQIEQNLRAGVVRFHVLARLRTRRTHTGERLDKGVRSDRLTTRRDYEPLGEQCA